MSIVFRLVIALGVPFGFFLILGGSSGWMAEQPNAPAVFLAFWFILWVQPLWVNTRAIDTDTSGNLLSVITPSLALIGVVGGLAGSVVCAIGHPYADLTGGTVFVGIAVLWGVVCLSMPGLLGGFNTPLANAGPTHDPREGIMSSHTPPVTSMPLSRGEQTPPPASDE